MTKIVKDTIHANGIDIGIYTTDFENEFISLTDIARYKSDELRWIICLYLISITIRNMKIFKSGWISFMLR